MEPSAFHQPPATVPGGHVFRPPFTTQQNSVYPSQHAEPQPQRLSPHRHTAPYAVPGFRMNSSGATVSAVPANAVRTMKLRRVVWRSSTVIARSTNHLLTTSPPPAPSAR